MTDSTPSIRYIAKHNCAPKRGPGQGPIAPQYVEIKSFDTMAEAKAFWARWKNASKHDELRLYDDVKIFEEKV
jgi:hypothetical protein